MLLLITRFFESFGRELTLMFCAIWISELQLDLHDTSFLDGLICAAVRFTTMLQRNTTRVWLQICLAVILCMCWPLLHSKLPLVNIFLQTPVGVLYVQAAGPRVRGLSRYSCLSSGCGWSMMRFSMQNTASSLKCQIRRCATECRWSGTSFAHIFYMFWCGQNIMPKLRTLQKEQMALLLKLELQMQYCRCECSWFNSWFSSSSCLRVFGIISWWFMSVVCVFSWKITKLCAHMKMVPTTTGMRDSTRKCML